MKKVTMYKVGATLYESFKEARRAEAQERLESRLREELDEDACQHMIALLQDQDVQQDLLLLLKK